MKHIIRVPNAKGVDELYANTIDMRDETYLRTQVLPHLQPVSNDFYVHSFSILIQTLARWSYVLDDNRVYWCIEWEPGMLVIAFTPERTIEAVAVQTLRPSFDAPTEEQGVYDDGRDNQRTIIFDAWDVQFDKKAFAESNFMPLAEVDVEKYLAALASIDSLAPEIEAAYQTSPETFFAECKEAIAVWAGKGVATTAVSE